MGKRKKKSKNKSYYSKNDYTYVYTSFEVESKEIHQLATTVFGSTYYISYDELTSSS